MSPTGKEWELAVNPYQKLCCENRAADLCLGERGTLVAVSLNESLGLAESKSPFRGCMLVESGAPVVSPGRDIFPLAQKTP
jgi:hypothetical protein